ncbi:hypothetical protein BpHYR1_048706 [Brachionus plicatilis]|uniref:Uncharacterized protein n=1 Tax=Brachionus plicatilis TaxID=10195 RepID=A0A3M7P703_BRAPC|nr:hypothetical protein BpHYR1_048706 [Brachionus plicatilis]
MSKTFFLLNKSKCHCSATIKTRDEEVLEINTYLITMVLKCYLIISLVLVSFGINLLRTNN